MKEAFAEDPDVSIQAFRLSTAVMCALTVGALGYAGAVVTELAFPGALGPGRILLLAVLVATLFFCLAYPGVGLAPAAVVAEGADAARSWRRWQRVRRLVILLPVAVAGWVWLAPGTQDAAMREPFAGANGVSAWPSELLRTLAVVLFPHFLDRAWNSGIEAAHGIGRRYFCVEPPVQALFQPPLSVGQWRSRLGSTWSFLKVLYKRWQVDRVRFVRRLLHRIRLAAAAASLWFWQPREARTRRGPEWEADMRVDGRRLWKAYFGLLRNGPRLGRLVVWLVITMFLVGAIVWVLGGKWPDTPVRGLADRALFDITNALAVIGAVTLLVLVSNAAVLTYRFILIMKQGRTIYPEATIDRFAAELGLAVPPANPRLYYPIAARPADRRRLGVVARNSLFDPWIDTRLMAKHTDAIAPLIVFPFVLLGLLIVARSRLFDNWEVGVVMMVLGFYLLWAAAMAALLNLGAETARRKALDDLAKDLLWLKGAGPQYKELADQFPRVIDQDAPHHDRRQPDELRPVPPVRP